MMVRAEPWHWHGSEQAAESQSPEGAERVDWLGYLTATPMRCRPVVSGLLYGLGGGRRLLVR